MFASRYCLFSGWSDGFCRTSAEPVEIVPRATKNDGRGDSNWARKERSPEPKADDQNLIASLQREMNRVFESFWTRAGDLNWPWGGGDAKSDVVETKDHIEFSIELPGMDMSDNDVSLTDDMLTVKGEKKVERQEEKKGYYLSERSYGAIYRTIPLPPGVDGKKAEASFRNGVLTIKLPQTPEAQAKVKRIEVQAA